jgi:uridylate kinase
MDVVVVSIGGSVLIPDDEDSEYVSKLAGLLKDISTRVKLYIVVGGGRISRYYINIGRRFGTDERTLDEMGVEVTRLNARLLSAALSGHANHHPPKTVEEAVELGKNQSIVVMGGTTPGHTTDGVAAMLAGNLEADRVVNATAVDGVYTKDPNEFSDAERIERMSFGELEEQCRTQDWKAGPSNVFDDLGAGIIAKARIPLLVVKGRDLDNLGAAIEGKPFSGTTISEG